MLKLMGAAWEHTKIYNPDVQSIHAVDVDWAGQLVTV